MGYIKMSIKILQDNARPHYSTDDGEIIRAEKADGWNTSMIFQPSNSSDFNIRNLSFLNSI